MKFLLVSFFALFTVLNTVAQEYPWKKDEILPAKELAAKINTNAKDLPSVLNIGPMENIKTALKIGPTNYEAGLVKLSKRTHHLDKKKVVVIYCGCCAYATCPNIKPAYTRLKELGFTHVRVLDLPVGIHPDWVVKGFPMEPKAAR